MKKGITDMYLASALMAYGAAIDAIDVSNPNRQEFIFTRLPDEVWILDGSDVAKVDAGSLNDLENLFNFRRLMFPPSMPDCIKQIKTLIYRQKNGNK